MSAELDYKRPKIMKNLIILASIILITFNCNSLKAQKSTNRDTLTIKTSTECNMCKERVEKEMAYTKGVVSSSLNVEKAILTVIYKANKTTPENIRVAISNLGYDADSIKADKTAHDKLPYCCQKGGMSR